MPPSDAPNARKKRRHFRRFTLRGLAVVLPPLLTVVILVWIADMINDYLLRPINSGVHLVIAQSITDARTADVLEPPPEGFPRPPADFPPLRLTPEFAQTLETEGPPAGVADDPDDAWDWVLEEHGEDVFVRLDPITAPAAAPASQRPYIPLVVYRTVVANVPPQELPQTPTGFYEAYIDYGYLGRFGTYLLSFIGVVIVLAAVYFLGRFLTFSLGRALWGSVERGIFRVPLVRSVYSSVKQVTDFVLTEREMNFQRVVAIEYPRRGIWSLAFVMSESLLDLEKATGEPMLAVLIPTSPAPFTGFTMTVRRREAIDLALTVEQALQFIVSCGVVVPPHQVTEYARQIQLQRAEAKALVEAPAAESAAGEAPAPGDQDPGPSS